MTQDIRKPDFFIVGAPKCGTTAMTEYLRQHPDIFIPDFKELHYFGSDLNFRPLLNRAPEWFEMTEQKYLSYFIKAVVEKKVGESSVLYLYSKKAALEIKEFNPDADIIIMLRNPVDMLYSWHSQNLYVGNEDIENFKDALDAEEDRKHGLRVPDTAFWVEGLYYRDMAKYPEHVSRYIDVFGRNKVHIIIFDDFKKDAGRIYKKVLGFLGVNIDFVPDFRVINPNKVMRSKALQKFLIKPPSILQPLGEAVSRNRIIRDLIVLCLTRFNTRYEARLPLDLKLRRSLQVEFIPDLEKLSKLLDRDFTYWGKER